MPNIQYFLGANSSQGFYSLYDQLIPPETARAVYILKGGPGCGKSTLMKQVAARAEAAGLPVERILCSGDPASLDAVVLPTRQIALVDGTAPHVVEPKCPGAVDHYVNLGACYNADALAPLHEELAAATAAYQNCYPRAYRCLAAAAQLQEDDRAALLTPALEQKLARRAAGILKREVRRVKGHAPGRVKRRFLSAITHAGAMTLYPTALAQCNRVYELSDRYGLAHTLLTHLLSGITAAGHDAVVCPAPLSPERMEHLLVPELGLAFLTVTPDRDLPTRPYRRLRLDAMPEPELLRRLRPQLRLSAKLVRSLTDEAVQALAQAKAKHDVLEDLYHPHVDFARVDEMAQEILARLF